MSHMIHQCLQCINCSIERLYLPRGEEGANVEEIRKTERERKNQKRRRPERGASLVGHPLNINPRGGRDIKKYGIRVP